jgi:hypothetical protein
MRDDAGDGAAPERLAAIATNAGFDGVNAGVLPADLGHHRRLAAA